MNGNNLDAIRRKLALLRENANDDVTTAAATQDEGMRWWYKGRAAGFQLAAELLVSILDDTALVPAPACAQQTTPGAIAPAAAA